MRNLNQIHSPLTPSPLIATHTFHPDKIYTFLPDKIYLAKLFFLTSSFPLADFGFLIAYDDTTDIRDIPILYNVRNNRVPAVTMCTWYRLSQYPDRYSRSLFHYIIDQRLEGFQVWLRSNPNKLRISLIEESIEVDFPVRQKSWVHLCVRWDQGRYFSYVHRVHSFSTYVKFSEKLTFLAP